MEISRKKVTQPTLLTLKAKACPASPAPDHPATGQAWPGGPMQIAAPALLQSCHPREKAWRACRPRLSMPRHLLARRLPRLTAQTGWPDWLAGVPVQLWHPANVQQPPDQEAPVHSLRAVQRQTQGAGPATAGPSKQCWLQPAPRPPVSARASPICFVKVPSCADYDGSDPSSNPCLQCFFCCVYDYFQILRPTPAASGLHLN